MMYKVEKHLNHVLYSDEVEKIKAIVPVNKFGGLITVTEPPKLKWPEELWQTLRTPIASPALKDLARGHKRVGIIVPDATRGVPVAKILLPLTTELADAGIKLASGCFQANDNWRECR
jgi:nickel-dependent lactate racemase